MREIKFRGLTKDDIWLYGDLYHGLNHELYINHVVKDGNSNTNILTMILKESAGQYTGLKDKNEKEIYEGDILKHGSTIGLVKFGAFQMDFRDTNILMYGYYYDETPINYRVGIEIIGNIHQNPAIIK